MSIKATVTVTNNLGQIAGKVSAGALHGTTVAAQRLLALSKDRVPEDQGTLGLSGAVESAKDTGDGAEAAVVYSQPYAARLHEHPEYNFSTKSNPRAQGKYVEEPAMENRAELLKIVETEIEREFNV